MILTIPLLYQGKILIKAGQKVDFDVPLYEEKKAEEVKIHLSQRLEISPNKIFDYLKKFVGEQVKKGDLLAVKKSFFEDKKILSEIDGLLKEINHNEGYILIDSAIKKEKTRHCFFKGEVRSVEKNQIKLNVNQLKDYRIKESAGIGDDLGGRTFYLKEKQESFTEEEVDGRIIVGAELSSYQTTKLEALGARAFATLHHINHASIPSVIFKNIEDSKSAFNNQLPYCIIDGREGKIFFYS
jgi:hypothetical protein